MTSEGALGKAEAIARSIGWTVGLVVVALLLAVAAFSDSLELGPVKLTISRPEQRFGMGLIAVACMVVAIILRSAKSRRSAREKALQLDSAKEELATETFLRKLDDVESFDVAFRDCTRIDLLLRTGANVLHRYRRSIILAARSGTKIRILVLNPSSPAARIVYGPGSDQYLNNARLLPTAIREIEAKSKGNVSIRKTNFLPPFSMFVAYKRGAEESYARAQVNFTHTAVGGDRPTFRVSKSSSWFSVFEEEFRDAWKSGSRTGSIDLDRTLDGLARTLHSNIRMNDLFTRVSSSAADPECPFDTDGADQNVFHSTLSTKAIPNIAPIVRGHCLVVPKRHVERLADLTANEVSDLFECARIISLKLMKELHSSGVNWALQDGSDAGQTVKHVHVHIIPRSPHDLSDPGEWFAQLPGGAPVAQAVDDPARERLTPDKLKVNGDEMKELMSRSGSD